MVRILHFVKKPEIRRYNVQNQKVELEINEHIFPPSAHGQFFAENMNIKKGESVIDIGTGSGFLAILAAKLGGNVSATDNDKDAIETAKKNAANNNVKIDFKRGEYFANFQNKFDVILANLPQEWVHLNYKNALTEQQRNSLDGGEGGNAQILKFLDIAKNYMHKNSRIYIIIYTVTDFSKTLKKIIENYNVKLMSFDEGPAKEFVEDNIEWYKKLNEEGKIRIFKKEDKWMANEYLFKLTKKSSL